MGSKPRPKKPKVTEIRDLRQLVGIYLGRGKAPPYAHAIYRVTFSDGSSKILRGRNIQTLTGSEHLNGTKKQRELARRNLREDLYDSILASQILVASVEQACWRLDQNFDFEVEDGF